MQDENVKKAVYYSTKLNDKSSVNFTKKAKQKVNRGFGGIKTRLLHALKH